MKLIKSFLKGILIGLLFLPLQFFLFFNTDLVKAQDLREELRSQAELLREEIRGEIPCADGSSESCSRSTPERPEHREPCGGCLPSTPPQPSPSTGPGPSIQPTPQPSSQPGPSTSGVGGNSGGTSENGNDETSNTTTSESAGGVSSAQVLGLSYTSSK
jgi:hypothetical protein